jgi:hypothetical protein
MIARLALALRGPVTTSFRWELFVDWLGRKMLAAWRNAGEFVGAPEFGGERVAVRTARAACNAPVKIVARMAGGVGPWPLVGHRGPSTQENP